MRFKTDSLRSKVFGAAILTLGAVCLLSLSTTTFYDTTSDAMTEAQLRSITGSAIAGCALTDPLTDCNVEDETCAGCVDSGSRTTVEAHGDFNVKIYLGADRKICKAPDVENSLTCDEGTVVCWTEKTCVAGGI